MRIPFLDFEGMHHPIREEIIEAFKEFYDSNWYVLGERVKAFESAYAAFNNTRFCVGVSNGLDALHIALRSLNIGEGDEVIVPSNTYIATLLAVSYTGAKVVLVEPDIESYNLDPARVESAITSCTKAILPVHLYGQSCEMEPIMGIAQKFGLYVVEDNAQSQGATFKGRLTGSWGDINATSFYPGKNLGALGDAGAVTTNNIELARAATVLRNYGSEKKYYNEVIGYNMRLDECQAAFLSIKLKYLEGWNKQRMQIAALYNEGLKDLEEVITPVTKPGASHVFHLYVIRTNRRDDLQAYLANFGIGTLIHYPVPPHLQKAYSHMCLLPGQFPIAEEIANTCLSLPVWPGMSQSDVEFVTEKIHAFFKN